MERLETELTGTLGTRFQSISLHSEEKLHSRPVQIEIDK